MAEGEESQAEKDSCRISYISRSWIAAIIYSTGWGIGLSFAYTDLNLKSLDIAMTVFIFVFCTYFCYLTLKLSRTMKELTEFN